MQEQLNFSNVYKNFFLVHDFLQRFCKQNPHHPEFFDLQYDIQKKIKKAGERGAYAMQLGVFAGYFLYCWKGNNKILKIIGGVLYVRWINHFYTLGSYMGVLTRLSGLSKKVQKYYQQHPNEANIVKQLKLRMNRYDDSEIDQVLDDIFPKEALKQQNSYVSNPFFIKNKSHFFRDQEVGKKEGEEKRDGKTQIAAREKLKLNYFDNFITRYIYHNTKRWWFQLRRDIGF